MCSKVEQNIVEVTSSENWVPGPTLKFWCALNRNALHKVQYLQYSIIISHLVQQYTRTHAFQG